MKSKRRGLWSVVIRSFDVKEETYSTARRFDDLTSRANTGSEEHLVSDFEHMQISLCLTDEKRMRYSQSDKSWDMFKTSRDFEIRSRIKFEDSLLVRSITPTFAHQWETYLPEESLCNLSFYNYPHTCPILDQIKASIDRTRWYEKQFSRSFHVLFSAITKSVAFQKSWRT